MPLFCRHNRFEHTCPICTREKKAAAKPVRSPAARRAGTAPGAGRPRSAPRLVTKKLARAEDDGYRNDLVPGIKATQDAERLAAALVVATERLEFPGPYPAVAEQADDVEQSTWLAFLLALIGPDRPELQQAVSEANPAWGSEVADLGAEAAATVEAYRAWAARAGSQRAAFTGEASWTPQRRFGRVFERLSLPGFDRAKRHELLNSLGAAGVYELEADGLHPGGADDATVAAKRALITGDVTFLERRAKALAEGAGVPIGALDRGLALWERSEPIEAPDSPLHDEVRAALGLSAGS